MLFKQSVLKEEKIKLGIVLGIVALSHISLVIINFIGCFEWKYLIAVSLVLFLPVYLLTILVGLKYLEWYYIFDDRIEVRCFYCIKNVVNFDNVEFVEELKINLTSRGMEKTFYIFNDGRKNTNSFFNFNSCYNKRKLNLRIYKTDKLENYIQNNFKFPIVVSSV